MLRKYNIKNIVLIGGRLSRFKLDNDSITRTLWEDKMDWILSTNHIWDKVDKIFLEEIPTTFYFDKRKTNWISDFDSVKERNSFTAVDQNNFENFRARWLKRMFMMPSDYKAYY